MLKKTKRSRKPKTKENNSPTTKRFRIFVRPVDEFGFPDEDRFGWVSFYKNKIELMLTWDNAIIFEEKENGHGSFEDWKKFFEDEYPDWRIENGPSYVN